MGEHRYWVETLGCPKNQVDSEKLEGWLAAQGYAPARTPAQADVLVVNTCAFVEAARRESVDAVLELACSRRPGARLVVTGCLAERYGSELAAAMPEVDLVAAFGQPLVEGPVRAANPPRRAGGRPVPVSLQRDAPAGIAGTVGTAAGPGTVGTAAGPGTVGTAAGPGTVGTAAGTGGILAGFDLLSLPRPPTGSPWAYLKVAEGCDRSCGFCAIPSFRGPQRSRPLADVLAEAAVLARPTPAGPGAREIVLVAQDLVSYGRDRRSVRAAAPAAARSDATCGSPLIELVGQVAALVPRVRLLYLYPSGLTDDLVQAILGTGVPYFDLSLQHVSRPLLARMGRWGSGERFLERIGAIRSAAPDATFRSSFILGYPGETEEDHDELLAFLEEAQLDWAGFFPFSPEEGTRAVRQGGQVPPQLALERLRECAELQDAITAARRDRLVGARRTVLVDEPGIGRTVHEAPEIDGVVHVPASLPVGSLAEVTITASLVTDLVAEVAPGQVEGSAP